MRMTIVSRGAPRSWPPAHYGHPGILQLLQDVRPGVLHALGLLVGHHQVVILGLDVVGAADDHSELGVSDRMTAPMVMMAAGTAASPRLTRHPHPPLILEVGGENSDGDHELETEVQRASEATVSQTCSRT